MRKAIVVVDMQNDFVDGALGTAEAQAMLPRMVEKLTAARAAGTALVFTMDTHGANYLTTQEGEHLPVPHCIRGTAGWAIVEALRPFADAAAAVIEKPTFGTPRRPRGLRCDRVRRALHGYLRHLECPPREGVLPRKAHQCRCRLLCGRHAREPHDRTQRDASMPDRGARVG